MRKRSKKAERKVLIGAAVPNRLRDKLEARADRDEVSISEVVRRSLSSYLEKREVEGQVRR